MEKPVFISVLQGTRNNLYITVVDKKGMVLFQRSIGMIGLKNSSKKTVFGAELLGKSVGEELIKKNILSIRVRIQGKWYKSEQGCVRGFVRSGIKISDVEYMLGAAHNGVRPKKRRRR